jgi:23S rRNA (adenine-N6)-dimethyltransferase
VFARRRTPRDERRRRLGQNFLRPEFAEQFVAETDLRPGEFVLEIGAGVGAITCALAQRPVEVTAVEIDPVWAERLRHRLRGSQDRVRIVAGDFLSMPLPTRPFRVIGSLPFGATTDILRHLLDDPRIALERADFIVQWEVARKRAAVPPSTLRSTTWAPWWEFQLGRRIPATAFQPIPRVDSAVLTIERRRPPLLPPAMAQKYSQFVSIHWPFAARN